MTDNVTPTQVGSQNIGAKAVSDLIERPDILQWQKDQSEFFDATTREIVGEYAAWRDKQKQAEVARLREALQAAEILDHQRQLDQDGCFVGVSRQAIDEVLQYLGVR